MNKNRAEQLFIVQKKIKYEFADVSLLDLALTHSSAQRDNSAIKEKDYERLEFLGDAVLELCVSETLYVDFEELSEGEMTRIRAKTVNETALCDVAKAFGMGEAIRLSKGEDATGGRGKSSILSDSLEALIGAIYLDGGMERAKAFVKSFSIKKITEAISGIGEKDYKTALQEYVQKNRLGKIEYILNGESGPDHDKQFFIEVSIDGAVLGAGAGKTKQEAGQNAANKAMAHYLADK